MCRVYLSSYVYCVSDVHNHCCRRQGCCHGLYHVVVNVHSMMSFSTDHSETPSGRSKLRETTPSQPRSGSRLLFFLVGCPQNGTAAYPNAGRVHWNYRTVTEGRFSFEPTSTSNACWNYSSSNVASRGLHVISTLVREKRTRQSNTTAVPTEIHACPTPLRSIPITTLSIVQRCVRRTEAQ